MREIKTGILEIIPDKRETGRFVKSDDIISTRLQADPGNSVQVAQALRRYFTRESDKLALEMLGRSDAGPVREAAPTANGTTKSEIAKTTAELNTDIKALLESSSAKKIVPELEGMLEAIRSIAGEGVEAAHLAIETHHRDVTLRARRQLSDYARVLRTVGALTPRLTTYYRQVAKDLDVLSALMLVVMGETFSLNDHYSGLLPSVNDDLISRKAAVMHALRNLLGSTAGAYGQNEWPRGIVAYQEFLQTLDDQGQHHIRAILTEKAMARLLEETVTSIEKGNAVKVRGTNARAQFNVQLLSKLLLLGNQYNIVDSPPFAALMAAVDHFVSAFNCSATARRLIHFARPGILNYGIYGMAGPDHATAVLLALSQVRGTLAEICDCIEPAAHEPGVMTAQIVLDKVLYDLDQSIDYFIQGSSPSGQGDPEQRARAVSHIINQLYSIGPKETRCVRPIKVPKHLEVPLRDALKEIVMLLPLVTGETEVIANELYMQLQAEERWQCLFSSIAPHCLALNGGIDPLKLVLKVIEDALDAVGKPDAKLTHIPQTGETSLEILSRHGLGHDHEGYGHDHDHGHGHDHDKHEPESSTD